jgi:hypothetical protein
MCCRMFVWYGRYVQAHDVSNEDVQARDESKQSGKTRENAVTLVAERKPRSPMGLGTPKAARLNSTYSNTTTLTHIKPQSHRCH